MKKTFIVLLVFVALATSSPASALDNTWISNPSLAYIHLTGTGLSGSGSSYSLSTQTLHPVMVYDGGVAQGGKFAQVSFFDFSGTVSLELESGTNGVSSTACDHQTLGGNAHTCFFRMDDQGKATFNMTLANTSIDSHFKFLVLAGPNISQSSAAQVNFVRPIETIAPVTLSTRGMSGGAGVVQFRVLSAGVPASGINVALSVTGVGENLSSATAVSNSRGLIVVYLSNFSARPGSAVITAIVIGGSSSAQARIVWSQVNFVRGSSQLPNTGTVSGLHVFTAAGIIGLGAGFLTLTRALHKRH